MPAATTAAGVAAELRVRRTANGYNDLVLFENSTDPNSGMTRLTVKNPASGFLLGAYGSSAPGALASAATIVALNPSSRFLVGAQGTRIQFYVNDNFSSRQVTLRSSGMSILRSGADPVCALDVGGPVRCASYTVATVPNAAVGDGMMIFVTNPSAGSARPYWSRGGSWYDAAGTALA